ncbi:hypothetical protein P4B35_22810 [Pontiellaceae bacterium B12227]|nr:hypothetical protein [Pontiellaceae bacterium B12227]
MNDFFTTLITLGAVIFICFQLIAPLLLTRKIKNIPKLPTSDLVALFENKKHMFFAAATEELKSRGEDIKFTFPHYLSLALSGNAILELIGTGALRTYFPDVVKDIDLTKTRLKKETRAQLQEMQNKLDELTTHLK